MYGTINHHLQINRTGVGAESSLYTHACKRGQRRQLWAGLTGRSRGLLALEKVSAGCSVEAQSDGGIRTVPINQIRGSENRCADFDCDFYPLQNHTRQRWLSIAQARRQGKALPPVVLVQIGEVYFVRDGHHRISVAQALGQKAIEARVVVWHVTRPLSWGIPARAASSVA
jgi:hypothetical protein